MKPSHCLCLLAYQASCAAACQREMLHSHLFNPHEALSKREEAVFPPVLDQNEAILTNSFDNTSIATWSYYYTHGFHVAGSNQTMAQWTADRWNEFGLSAGLASYYVYLNYPVSHSLSATFANGSTWTASLREEALAEDDVTTYPNSVPTFHGYSFTGDAEAEYVYVGRGQQVDFERVKALGVSLEGHGMIGCVIFTDTADDGNVTEANGYAAYPHGPARNPTSVQRGSVQFLSTYPGDPTTPGYPSRLDSPRADISPVTPRIPSLPIFWKDAQPLLQALDGHGPSGETVNRTNWIGKLNATYSTGPAPGTTISLSNVMRDEITWIWDAVGIINGTSEDEVIVVGNHRDAWIVGGAADPNSGSAIMVELAKAFGALLKTGWKPRRTIVLCSWDAEEYGLLGSTEWVEEYIPWLSKAAVAYLNIDVAVSGPNPWLSGTPELHEIATTVMKKVVYPYRGYNNFTLYDVWYGLTKGEVGVLGSGSDYTSFVHNGISSLDMGSGGGPTDPVYHYHSNYDDFHWMSTFGDPGFNTHKVMGQYLTLLTYHLANDAIVPFNVENYGVQMTLYLENLAKDIAAANATVDLSPLESAIAKFNASAAAFTETVSSASTEGEISLVNAKFRDFSRGFVSQGGLPTREFYKHVVFAPGVDTGYAPTTWPGITEAVDAGNYTLANTWVQKSARAVEVAAAILSP